MNQKFYIMAAFNRLNSSSSTMPPWRHSIILCRSSMFELVLVVGFDEMASASFSLGANLVCGILGDSGAEPESSLFGLDLEVLLEEDGAEAACLGARVGAARGNMGVSRDQRGTRRLPATNSYLK